MRHPYQIRTLGLIAALGAAGSSVQPVYGQTQTACSYSNVGELRGKVSDLKERYGKALHDVLGPFTCAEFADLAHRFGQPASGRNDELPPILVTRYQAALDLNHLFTEGSTLFTQTGCIDFLLVGVFSYNAYFNRSCRTLSPPAPIIQEYGRVQAALEQSRRRVSEAVINNDVAYSTKVLDAFANNFTPEYQRTSALFTKYKAGLGLGISAVVLGAGLVIAGAALQAVNGMQTSPSGCAVDGLDFACARQVDLGARVALFSVGGIFLAAGVVELPLIRRWIGRQRTYSAAAPATASAPAGETGAAPAAAE